MSYRIEADDQGVRAAVRRIATEQVEKALAEIDSDLDRTETIHQVRKRCKKIRGLVRLVRPVFDEYSDENRAFRDAARSLSDVRDAGALVETYDALTASFEDQIDRRAFASIRRRLTADAKAAETRDDVDARVARFRAGMVKAHRRVATWRLDGEGFGAVSGGLAKTYGRARSAMAKARDEPTDERLHEWRKRVKYHWYHARLMRRSWSKMLKPHEKAADALSDLLGDHHDLAVLRARLREDPEAFGSRRDLDASLALAQKRQDRLVGKAMRLSDMLLAETPEALAKRWGAYWRSSRLADGRARKAA